MSIPGKKLLIAIASIAAVLGVGIGGVLLANRLSAKGALLYAVGNSSASFVEAMDNNSELITYYGTMSRLQNGGDYQLQLSYTANDTTFASDYRYSRNNKKMAGYANVNALGFGVSADFSIDDDLLVFSNVGNGREAYGISLNDLDELIDDSPVGHLIPDELASVQVDPFEKFDINSILPAESKKNLNALIKSIDIDYLDYTSVTGAYGSIPCEMYQVTWNEKYTNELIASMKRSGGAASILAHMSEFIRKMDPDARFYVNKDDELIGLDVVLMGANYVFLLEGTDNLWDKFSLTVSTLNGLSETYTGGIYHNASGVEFYLGNDEVTYLSFRIDDSGEFSLETLNNGTILIGELAATSNKAEIGLTINLPELGEQQITCIISELKTKPVTHSGSYIDLLSMDLSDWQRLLFDLEKVLP